MKSTTARDDSNDWSEEPNDREHPLRFAVRAVDRFFYRPLEPTSLGLMRIATGILVLYVHLVYCIGLSDYLGPNAWVVNKGWTNEPGESGVTDYMRHGATIPTPSMTWDDMGGDIIKGQTLWSIFFHVEDPFWIRVIHGGVLLVMLLFTLGLWTPITSKLTWIGSMMYIQRFYSTMLFGMDTMTNIGLFYLMLAPCGATLSLDRWLHVRAERRRLGSKYVARPPEPLVGARFITRVIQINFCILYGAAGTSKLLGSSWWNATAPNRFLLNYSFAPFEVAHYTDLLKFLAAHRWMWEIFCTIGVVYTLCLELGFPFLVWNRRTRWLMVCGSILFHTMIALLMGLVTFSIMMLALVVVFVPPEAVRQWLESLTESSRNLLSGRRAESRPAPSVAMSQ
jgi:hypothetical protein